METNWIYDKEFSIYRMPIDSRHEATFCPKRSKTYSLLLDISDPSHSRQLFSGVLLSDGSVKVSGDPHSYLSHQSRVSSTEGLNEPDKSRLKSLIDAIDFEISPE